MNLQTLLDERARLFDREFTASHPGDSGMGGNDPQEPVYELNVGPTEIKTFLKESILQGVRLGLAMGRECVPEEKHVPFNIGNGPVARQNIGFNYCRNETLAALEAKEKELGV
jgi:hypothetical protein